MNRTCWGLEMGKLVFATLYKLWASNTLIQYVYFTKIISKMNKRWNVKIYFRNNRNDREDMEK